MSVTCDYLLIKRMNGSVIVSINLKLKYNYVIYECSNWISSTKNPEVGENISLKHEKH